METIYQGQGWLDRVEGLFFRYGVRTLTMDDVSRELGMSKKTLYQMVENKDDLVRKVLENHISRERGQCLSMASQATNAIDEILLVMDSNSQEFAQMKANIVYDLQKYHPDAWALIHNFHYDFVYKIICENLERGRKEGLYREDFNIEIIAKLHLASVLSVFDEALFPAGSPPKDVLFREYMMHYLHGIVSERGVKFLQSKLQ